MPNVHVFFILVERSNNSNDYANGFQRNNEVRERELSDNIRTQV